MAVNGLELEIQGDVRKQTEALQKTFLETLGWKGVRKLEQFATVNAARALAPYVRDAAPTDSKALSKSVRGRRSKITRPGAVVGPMGGKRGAWYSWLVVKGVRAHTIPKITARNLFTTQKVIEHPGIRGNNFVINTVERKIRVGQDAMAKTIVLLMTDVAKRNKVLGLEIEYANGTATKFQQEQALRNWNKPDFIGPLTPLQTEGKRRREASDKVKAIAHTARVRQLRRDAGIFGISPNMSNLRAG